MHPSVLTVGTGPQSSIQTCAQWSSKNEKMAVHVLWRRNEEFRSYGALKFRDLYFLFWWTDKRD